MTRKNSPSWHSLFIDYLSGSVDLSDLYKSAQHPMERMVARIAPDLPVDLRKEVVDEVFVRLLDNQPTFAPEKCSINTFVFNLVRNAVRRVRAVYAPPGKRTRYFPEEIKSGMTVNDQGEDDRGVEIHNDRYDAIPVSEISVDETVSIRWTSAAIEAYAEAGELLSRLPDSVAMGIWMMYVEHQTTNETADALEVSRFALRRTFLNVKKWSRANQGDGSQFINHMEHRPAA